MKTILEDIATTDEASTKESRANIAIFATHDSGGAGESAYRIACGVRTMGHNTAMIVRYKTRSDSFIFKADRSFGFGVRILRKIKRVVLARPSFTTKPEFHFFNTDEESAGIPGNALLDALPFKPDIILLCWVSDFVNAGVASWLQQRTGAKVYWLMTDMAPLTGGCHYAWDCPGYQQDCSNCPAIIESLAKQTAARNLALKLRAVKKGRIQVIAGSEWTAQQAGRSALFREQPSIPVLNGLIDFEVFNSRCRDVAKQVFNVPAHSKLIFTGATFTADKRKGISEFVTALQQLYERCSPQMRTDIKVMISGKQLDSNKFVQQIPFDIVAYDFITDDRLLSLAYQAADVFVCSSLEDSGPMMVNEALACGTPVVGFSLGFVATMVISGVNGFQAPLGNTEKMADGILRILSLPPEAFQSYSYEAQSVVRKEVSFERLQVVVSQLLNEKL